MTTATATYSINVSGERELSINSKYKVPTNKTAAPASLDYKVDPAGNHLLSVGNNGLYETIDMLVVTNKI